LEREVLAIAPHVFSLKYYAKKIVKMLIMDTIKSIENIFPNGHYLATTSI
jgi:hypothetical protein